MSKHKLYCVFRRGKKLVLEITETVKYFVLLPLGKAVYGKRKIYLISERGNDARDNGLYFFQYMQRKYPEKEVYFVIDKKSPDYQRLPKDHTVVQYRSIKHYLLFAGAKYKISTHIMGFSPSMLYYTSLNQRYRVPGYHIFLQHGIIKDDLVGLYQPLVKVDRFICGAKPEYDFVKEHFKYKNHEVRYTGLARFDGLQVYKTKKQILFMPTWRVYCSGMNDDEFKNSDYYQAWNGLMHNEKLLKAAEEAKIQIVFYPHYEMQRYVHLFQVNYMSVKIADFANYDVQTLLKESLLLVTDFSSVFFDFAYMGKPCVYFQFDKDRFFRNQYKPGYFNYEDMGFGEVVQNEKEMSDILCRYIKQNFAVPYVYQKRMRSFFTLHDAHNCDRIWKTIEELK